MSTLKKREGDNLEILEIEEILKNRGYARVFDAEPDELQSKEYIKRIYTSEYDRFPGDEIYQLLWIE